MENIFFIIFEEIFNRFLLRKTSILSYLTSYITSGYLAALFNMIKCSDKFKSYKLNTNSNILLKEKFKYIY